MHNSRSRITKYHIGMKVAVISAAFFLSSVRPLFTAHADTLKMKNTEDMKGVVVEEYKDRIILSTADGEVAVMKSDIKELFYDDEESNLVKLGEQATDRKRYLKAVGYYSRALKVNPGSKTAKEGLVFLQLQLSSLEKGMVDEGLKKQDSIDRYGSYIVSEGAADEELKKARRRLYDSLGMVLEADENIPHVSSVRMDSPAYEAGIRRGDRLVAIWGRLTGYMSVRDVADRLLEKSSSEIRCTLGRNVTLEELRHGPFSGPEDIVGASLGIEFDGLTILKVREGGPADNAGLRKGDVISFIDGESTRYMPLKKVIENIRKTQGPLKLSINRNVIVWKR